MYVKLFKILNDEKGVSNSRGGIDEVTPTDNLFFDIGEEKIRYRKVKVDNANEFPNGAILFSPPTNRSPFEFLLIELQGKAFIAPNCAMFLMNNEGKTIDSIVCR